MRHSCQRILFLVTAAALIALSLKAGMPAGGQRRLYTYYDEAGNLQLELYVDPKTGRGCGTRYVENDVGGDKEACLFTTDSIGTEEPWIPPEVWLDPYSTKSFLGLDATEVAANIQVFWEYNAAGRPIQFQAQGVSSDPRLPAPVDVISLEFEYRDDGSLYRKTYSQNATLFGTTAASAEIRYDWEGRARFASCYITHGTLEFYPLYPEGAGTPDFLLNLDCFSGEALAHLYAWDGKEQ